MASVKQGDTITVNYTGKLSDGTIFDSSVGRHPLQFTLGKGALIAGFEQAVIGMNAGEKKTVVIPTAEAYGPRKQSAVVEVERGLSGQLRAAGRPATGTDAGGRYEYPRDRHRAHGYAHYARREPSAGRQGPDLRDRSADDSGLILNINK